MASLDQAFIKAYRQQETAGGAISLDPSGTPSMAEAPQDRPLREAKEQTSAAGYEDVLAAVQAERVQAEPCPTAPAPPPKPAANPSERDAVLEAGNGAVPHFLRGHSTAAPPAASLGPGPETGDDGQSGRTARIDAGVLGPAERGRVVPSPHIDTGACGAAPCADARVDSETPSGTEAGCASASPPLDGAVQSAVSPEEDPAPDSAHAPSSAPVPEPPSQPPAEPAGTDGPEAGRFRPLLQVDRLAASPVGQRLQQRAADEMDCLAAALLALAGEDRKVVGFASDHAGQGTTTLLSSAALRLAERGVPLALIDANLAGPRLATELGLLPEYGWEKVLAGTVPVEELVVESVEQSMGVMPLCRQIDAAEMADDAAAFRNAVATLRAHYGLVLVDLGVPCGAAIGRMFRALDTVLLVRDMRSTHPERLFELHRTLGRAEVHVAGIIESFVRGG